VRTPQNSGRTERASSRWAWSFSNHFWFKNYSARSSQTVLALQVTLSLAFICGLCLSWKLWVTSRSFPLTPVTSLLPPIPAPWDELWLFVLLGLLLAITVVAQPRRLILVFLALAGSLSLWDQTRWQPWFYQYLFMLAALGFIAWKPKSGPRPALPERGSRPELDACRLIVVSTYFWSGLQKLNATFIKETWPDIAGPWLRHLPEAVRRLPAPFVLIIPVAEIAIGVGLVARRSRNSAVALAVATHIFVLALLVRSGENTVVWPWNLAVGVFVVVLFWRDQTTGPRTIFALKNGLHALILLLFTILPALSLFDLWDSYLSSALYSGNTDQAVIYVSPEDIQRLPAPTRPHIWQSSQPFFLDINRWSYAELNVPVYPEPRVYRRVAEQVCGYAGNSSDMRLRIKEKPNPLTGARKSEYYDCEHLSN
jgi:hypothetical protein